MPPFFYFLLNKRVNPSPIGTVDISKFGSSEIILFTFLIAHTSAPLLSSFTTAPFQKTLSTAIIPPILINFFDNS